MEKRIDNGIKLLARSGARAARLLRVALALALLSALLFIGCSIMENTSGFSRVVQGMYVVAHLSAALGVSLLFWSVVSVPDEVGGSRDKLPCVSVFAITAYHLAAMVCYALAYHTNLYDMAVMAWWARALMSLFIVVDFVFFGDAMMMAAGILILIAFGGSGPYSFPDGLGIIQWVLTKLATITLYILLYLCAMRIYYPKDEGKVR